MSAVCTPPTRSTCHATPPATPRSQPATYSPAARTRQKRTMCWGAAARMQGLVCFFDLSGVMEVPAGMDRCEGCMEITPHFASPEQQGAAGQGPYTCRASDVYSWARSAYCLLLPYLDVGGDRAPLQPLLGLLERCTAADPATRPTATQAFDELAALQL